MNEYQDQVTWYELYGFDGFRWEFIADFDTKEGADSYNGPTLDKYEDTRTKRVRGLA